MYFQRGSNEKLGKLNAERDKVAITCTNVQRNHVTLELSHRVTPYVKMVRDYMQSVVAEIG